MEKIKKSLTESLKNHPGESFLVSLVLIAALILRLYRIDEYLTFLGDEGRDVRIVRDLLHGNFVFIGPQTSIGNMYLGPLYYYLMAPALFLSRLNPVGPAVMIAILTVITIFITWKLTRVWFDKLSAFFALLLYSLSPVAIIYGRSSWNPNPMPLFSILTIYFTYLALIKKQLKYLILTAVCLASALQMHYLGLLLIPVVLFWIVRLYMVNRKNQESLMELRIYVLKSLFVFFALMSPLLLFDLKHDFANSKAIIQFFSDRQTTVNLNPGNSNRFLPVVKQITSDLLLGQQTNLVLFISIILLFASLLLPIYYLSNLPFWLLYSWILIGVLGLSLYKQHVYAHYFGFLYPAIFIFTGLMLSLLFRSKIIPKILGLALLIIFTYSSVKFSPLVYPPNRQLQRTKSAVDLIISESNGQPFNFGLIAKQNYDESYRYFFENNNSKLVRGENGITDQLFVICEDGDKCQPEGNPAWQIAIFGPSKIDKRYQIDYLKIYRLVHTKG